MADMPNIFDLTGKAVFISGASSGIGLHTAKLLARNGAAVAMAARRADKLEAEVGKLRDAGRTACAVALDVTRPDTIAAAWDAAETSLAQPIDVLFNNAGIIYSERFVAQDPIEVARIFETNLTGAFLVAQHAARRMLERRAGNIINIVSTAGERASGHFSSYGASKAGLAHLTRIMALELAGRGVRVNALCPGNIRTDMHHVFEDKGFEETLLQRIPMRAIGEMDQLDGATLLLVSDASNYMTGVTIPVDGGQMLSWM